MVPTREEFESALIMRHTAVVYKKLKNAKVAVAGLGGLGSNIAVSLARSGIGHIHLVDFDEVDITNINRQQYMIRHIGMMKTKAMASIIEEINPYLNVTYETVKVTADNAVRIFADFPIVCEAFDRAEQKAMLVDALTDKIIISGSGMAGYGNSNSIVTRKITNRFYLCGDGVSDSALSNGLMAPRVALCAAHQANKVIELIIEGD